MQKAKQNFFKERTVFYSTFPIREQAEKGEWNYSLKAVYCIGILDFTFDDYKKESERKEVVHTIQLKNQHGKTFYEKLTYIYLEMPNFNKAESELETRLDKWLFFIRNLEDFQKIPVIFRNEAVFEQSFEKAELAKLEDWQWETYERNLKDYRDIKGYIDTAFSDGEIKAKNEVAAKLKQRDLSTKDISEITGLSEDEIDKL